ncbi:MarR family transcriptional regulator [Longimycelium tulufanense]|uniref:MarR family transcriptional regulator n=1 Tax=Longimycelium tulufanense TaxID=907463 RepID=A0A8J3CCM4_9PSEU|nr:helix-turn-helix domain-containing GNAT family N-acetyltransferase [Longimycelium tulufanense]GGM74115.1 MarR family transcriptional regulator [Longimycelium tulufanense]
MAVPDVRVAMVRAFNRFYTNVIGVLRNGMLGTAYSLTEARVLYELAQREHTEVAELRRTLDIDAGYLSRLLARFESAGLVARERSRLDGRRQVIRLTDRGTATYAELDTRSARQVRGLLEPLDEPQQRQVIAAMTTIQTLLGDPEGRAAPTPVTLRPPRSGDYGWVVHRHAALYARDHGWDETFEVAVARLVADFLQRRDLRREAAWIAELDGQPVGSVFCTAVDATTATLALLLVEPTARGHGIGTALVEECVRFARHAGYQRMTMCTADILEAGARLARRAGFQPTQAEPRERFGQRFLRQEWSRPL